MKHRFNRGSTAADMADGRSDDDEEEGKFDGSE